MLWQKMAHSHGKVGGCSRSSCSFTCPTVLWLPVLYDCTDGSPEKIVQCDVAARHNIMVPMLWQTHYTNERWSMLLNF